MVYKRKYCSQSKSTPYQPRILSLIGIGTATNTHMRAICSTTRRSVLPTQTTRQRKSDGSWLHHEETLHYATHVSQRSD